MAISQFPAPSGGGGLSNDFILDKNDTTNNEFVLPREFAAGGYGLNFSSGDTSYDVYFLNADGSAVGYSNSASIIASETFAKVVILGIGTAEQISFTFNGPAVDATSQGTATGAGAYLINVTPTDLAQIDDTAVVTGGNFAADLELSFVSGTVVKPAKNVVVGSSTAAVVTRPDDLIEDLAPYTLRAVNPGVPRASGSGKSDFEGITAGTDPAFITTSPIYGAASGVAFSSAILASDSEGTVVNWQILSGSLPAGITLGSADGALAGTPTTDGESTFTVQITDDGGNTNTREFIMPVGPQFTLTGGNSTAVGGIDYFWFTGSGSFVVENNLGTSLEYVIIAGGGGGGSNRDGGGGTGTGGSGGAGGLLFGTATLSADGTAIVTVGAGGAGTSGNGTNGINGVNSSVSVFGTATGGGRGGEKNQNGGAGGSGGGAGSSASSGGAGTAGQGNNGAKKAGGGAGAAAVTDTAGVGRDFGAYATAINIIVDGGFFAGGGASTGGTRGLGGGGLAAVGTANTGGGGGNQAAGGSGLVMFRRI